MAKQQQKIVISSQDRFAGDFNRFSVRLARAVTYRNLQVDSLTIPTSGLIFDGVADGRVANNIITFDEGGADLTAVITPGSYDEGLLIAEIKTRMDAAGALTYTVSIQNTPVTKRLIISATGAFALSCGSAGFPYRRLGYTPTDHASVANVVTSDYPIDIAPPRYLLIDIGGLDLPNIVHSGTYSRGQSIVAMLYEDSYGISHLDQNSAYAHVFSPQSFIETTVESLEVTISAPNHDYLLMQDWVIVLTACG